MARTRPDFRSRTSMTRASWGALGLGLLLLAILVGASVGLQRASAGEGGDGVDALPALPDSLPGGWTALETSGGPEGASADDAAAYNKQQRTAIAYVNRVLGGVYDDEPTEFRAYLDADQEALVTATVFAASGGAFAPANGVADPDLLGLQRAPVELTRDGDAVCISSYQSATQATGADPDTPVSVSCQQPAEGVTVQIGSQGLSVDDTVALLGDLTDSLGGTDSD